MYFKNSQTQSKTVKFGLRSAKFCRKEKGLFFSRLIEKPTKLGPLTGAAFTNAALGLSAVRPAGPASAGRSRLCRARKGEHRNWFIDEFVILFYPLGIKYQFTNQNQASVPGCHNFYLCKMHFN